MRLLQASAKAKEWRAWERASRLLRRFAFDCPAVAEDLSGMGSAWLASPNAASGEAGLAGDLFAVSAIRLGTRAANYAVWSASNASARAAIWVPAPLTRPYAGMESFSPRMSQAKHDKWEQTASLLREAMHAQTAAHAQALQEQQDSHVDRHRQLQRDMEALKMAHAKDQKDQQERYFTKVKELEKALQAKEQFIRQLRSDVQDLKQSHEGTLQAQKERFQRQLEAKATSLQELQDTQQEIWGVLQDMDMAHDKALEDQKLYYERALEEREADFQRRLQEKDESHQRQVQELAATKAAEGSDREVQEQKQNYERLLQEKDDSHQRQMQELLASKAAERGGQKEEAANPVLAANTAAHGSGRETQATGEPQAPDEASAKQKARASLIQAARDGSLEKSLQDFRQKDLEDHH